MRNLKVIATIICAIFLMEQCVYAAPSTRKTFRNSHNPSDQEIIQDPSLLDIPFEQVSLSEMHQGTNGKLIIHIQDAHANYGGQKSLANALDHLMTRYEMPLVLVEGASRDVTLNDVKKIAPSKIWKQVARKFLMEGKIAGEEYLNLVSDHQMRIRGVEDEVDYEEGLSSYANLASLREEVHHYLRKIEQSVSRVKNRIYPRELIQYEQKKSDKKLGAEAFSSQVHDLLQYSEKFNLALDDLPEVQRLNEVQHAEKTIDFEAANVEQIKMFESLREQLGGMTLESFVQSSKEARSSVMSQYLFMEHVFRLANHHSINIESYPHLKRYYDYLKSFSSIKMSELLKEIDILESRVYASSFHLPNQKTVWAIDQFVGLLKKAYAIQMSKHEYKRLQRNKEDFPTESMLAYLNRQLADLEYFEDLIPYEEKLDESADDMERFYKSVDKRDYAFINNAERIMTNESEDMAFLIAGGYHTEHLTEQLREKGYSYIVLTPVVTDETDHARYEEILLSEKTAESTLRPRAVKTNASRLSELIDEVSNLLEKPVEVNMNDLIDAARMPDDENYPIVEFGGLGNAYAAEKETSMKGWLEPTIHPKGMRVAQHLNVLFKSKNYTTVLRQAIIAYDLLASWEADSTGHTKVRIRLQGVQRIARKILVEIVEAVSEGKWEKINGHMVSEIIAMGSTAKKVRIFKQAFEDKAPPNGTYYLLYLNNAEHLKLPPNVNRDKADFLFFTGLLQLPKNPNLYLGVYVDSDNNEIRIGAPVNNFETITSPASLDQWTNHLTRGPGASELAEMLEKSYVKGDDVSDWSAEGSAGESDELESGRTANYVSPHKLFGDGLQDVINKIRKDNGLDLDDDFIFDHEKFIQSHDVETPVDDQSGSNVDFRRDIHRFLLVMQSGENNGQAFAVYSKSYHAEVSGTAQYSTDALIPLLQIHEPKLETESKLFNTYLKRADKKYRSQIVQNGEHKILVTPGIPTLPMSKLDNIREQDLPLFEALGRQVAVLHNRVGGKYMGPGILHRDLYSAGGPHLHNAIFHAETQDVTLIDLGIAVETNSDQERSHEFQQFLSAVDRHIQGDAHIRGEVVKAMSAGYESWDGESGGRTADSTQYDYWTNALNDSVNAVPQSKKKDTYLATAKQMFRVLFDGDEKDTTKKHSLLKALIVQDEASSTAMKAYNKNLEFVDDETTLNRIGDAVREIWSRPREILGRLDEKRAMQTGQKYKSLQNYFGEINQYLGSISSEYVYPLSRQANADRRMTHVIRDNLTEKFHGYFSRTAGYAMHLNIYGPHMEIDREGDADLEESQAEDPYGMLQHGEELKALLAKYPPDRFKFMDNEQLILFGKKYIAMLLRIRQTSTPDRLLNNLYLWGILAMINPRLHNLRYSNDRKFRHQTHLLSNYHPEWSGPEGHLRSAGHFMKRMLTEIPRVDENGDDIEGEFVSDEETAQLIAEALYLEGRLSIQSAVVHPDYATMRKMFDFVRGLVDSQSYVDEHKYEDMVLNVPYAEWLFGRQWSANAEIRYEAKNNKKSTMSISRREILQTQPEFEFLRKAGLFEKLAGFEGSRLSVIYAEIQSAMDRIKRLQNYISSLPAIYGHEELEDIASVPKLQAALASARAHLKSAYDKYESNELLNEELRDQVDLAVVKLDRALNLSEDMKADFEVFQLEMDIERALVQMRYLILLLDLYLDDYDDSRIFKETQKRVIVKLDQMISRLDSIPHILPEFKAQKALAVARRTLSALRRHYFSAPFSMYVEPIPMDEILIDQVERDEKRFNYQQNIADPLQIDVIPELEETHPEIARGLRDDISDLVKLLDNLIGSIEGDVKVNYYWTQLRYTTGSAYYLNSTWHMLRKSDQPGDSMETITLIHDDIQDLTSQIIRHSTVNIEAYVFDYVTPIEIKKQWLMQYKEYIEERVERIERMSFHVSDGLEAIIEKHPDVFDQGVPGFLKGDDEDEGQLKVQEFEDDNRALHKAIDYIKVLIGSQKREIEYLERKLDDLEKMSDPARLSDETPLKLFDEGSPFLSELNAEDAVRSLRNENPLVVLKNRSGANLVINDQSGRGFIRFRGQAHSNQIEIMDKNETQSFALNHLFKQSLQRQSLHIGPSGSRLVSQTESNLRKAINDVKRFLVFLDMDHDVVVRINVDGLFPVMDDRQKALKVFNEYLELILATHEKSERLRIQVSMGEELQNELTEAYGDTVKQLVELNAYEVKDEELLLHIDPSNDVVDRNVATLSYKSLADEDMQDDLLPMMNIIPLIILGAAALSASQDGQLDASHPLMRLLNHHRDESVKLSDINDLLNGINILELAQKIYLLPIQPMDYDQILQLFEAAKLAVDVSA